MLAPPETVHLTTFDVITTFADRHWEQYARRCVESFRQHWKNIPLTTFSDARLEADSDWLADFKAENAHRPTSNYRFDAVRFAHKVAALELGFAAGAADCMIWMDADCITHSAVDRAWLGSLLGAADFGYLRRSRKYPECGFLMIRRNDAGDELVRQLAELYRTGNLFKLAEWHDSWAIEEIRWQMEKAGQLRCVSLSGDWESTGHPFVNGPLGSRMDHCKGDRKAEGKSRQSDLKSKRTEEHWNG